jgi:hypothetical protein
MLASHRGTEHLWNRFMETPELRPPPIEIPIANPRSEADFEAFRLGPLPFCSDRRQIIQIRDIFSRYRHVDSQTTEGDDPKFGWSKQTSTKITLELRPPSERSIQLFKEYITDASRLGIDDLQRIAFALMWDSLFRTEPHRVTFKLITTESVSRVHGWTWYFMLALEYEGGGPSISFGDASRHPDRLSGPGENCNFKMKLLKMRLLDGIEDSDSEISNLQLATLLLMLHGHVGLLPLYLAYFIGYVHCIQ